MSNTIRPVEEEDLEALKEIIDSNQLFPTELLDGMLADYLHNKGSEDCWLCYCIGQQPMAVAYYAPEKMTEGTFNLYLIAVSAGLKGRGAGTALIEHIEDDLRKKRQRVLIIETSGLPEFSLSRSFYAKNGYTQEAVIRDFYQEGDDKVVFWKKL